MTLSARQQLLSVYGLKNLLCVAVGLHLGPNFGNRAAWGNQIGRALHAHVFFAIHAFFFPNAVAFQHRALFVRRQHDGKRVLGCEFIVALDRIGGDADHNSVGCFELRTQRAEINGLHGAAGSVILGVEIKDHCLVAEA